MEYIRKKRKISAPIGIICSSKAPNFFVSALDIALVSQFLSVLELVALSQCNSVFYNIIMIAESWYDASDHSNEVTFSILQKMWLTVLRAHFGFIGKQNEAWPRTFAKLVRSQV